MATKLHYCDLEDVAIKNLQSAAQGIELARLFTFCPGDPPEIYVSIKELAAATGRSRPPVTNIVRRRWANGRSAQQGRGTPMHWDAFNALLERAGVTLDQVRDVLLPPPSQRSLDKAPSHLAATAVPILVSEAQRLIDGRPSAIALERGAVRFSCGDAAERADVHHVTLAHALDRLRLWDPSKGRGEYAKLRRTLGKPVDGARLLALLHEQGVDVEAVAKRLGEVNGARDRANFPGRHVLQARKRVEPDHDLEAFDAGFAQWLEREHKAGRISDGMLYGGYAELRARYADLCGGMPRKRPKPAPDARDARVSGDYSKPDHKRSTPVGHDLADALAKWLSNPWERPGPITLAKAQVYVDVAVLARLAERSRKDVQRYVWEHWREREADHDHGIPITQQAYDLILDAADMDSAQAQATIQA